MTVPPNWLDHLPQDDAGTSAGGPQDVVATAVADAGQGVILGQKADGGAGFLGGIGGLKGGGQTAEGAFYREAVFFQQGAVGVGGKGLLMAHFRMVVDGCAQGYQLGCKPGRAWRLDQNGS